MEKKVICLMGPTAAGKTAIACDLVQSYPLEIISVDSAMVYRGMDIGTAKPSPEELRQAPHHLIDIIEPTKSFSAADFCQEAYKLCDAIFERKKIPLLVGGTMMYFHAFQQGLSVLPSADEALRYQMHTEAMQLGWPAMHQRLQAIDPISAAKIHPHDAQRIQRALEVFVLTQTPLSQLNKKEKNNRLQFVNIALQPEDRSLLHTRIQHRWDAILEQGFLQEVSNLLEQHCLLPHSPAMRCVGYRQAVAYLQKEYSYPVFCEKALAATRQLAKRQLTWLRHWPESHVVACDSLESTSTVKAIIEAAMET